MIEGAQPKQIFIERKNKAEDYIENYLQNEKKKSNYKKTNFNNYFIKYI